MGLSSPGRHSATPAQHTVDSYLHGPKQVSQIFTQGKKLIVFKSTLVKPSLAPPPHSGALEERFQKKIIFPKKIWKILQVVH